MRKSRWMPCSIPSSKTRIKDPETTMVLMSVGRSGYAARFQYILTTKPDRPSVNDTEGRVYSQREMAQTVNR